MYFKRLPGYRANKNGFLEYIHSILRWKDLRCYFTNRMKFNFNWQYVIKRRTYDNSSHCEKNKSISPEKTCNITFILGWRIQTRGLRSLPACLCIVDGCNVHRAELRHTIRAGWHLFHTPYAQYRLQKKRQEENSVSWHGIKKYACLWQLSSAV